jgi:N-dimethylarginine dimethylaminohydrolase
MSAPATAAQLEALGLPIDPIDVSEILAADGGLTCMSVIAPALAD